ncbi:MAG: hypothetical protein LBK62_02600 [Treponema sp.]|nr:hypothetical protein [Treponema sp.]
MRIMTIGSRRQVNRFKSMARYSGLVVFCLILYIALGSCGRKSEEAPVIPPPTSPLSRTAIGFGVINVSYTHISAEPAGKDVSSDYLRQGALVRVIERRSVKDGAVFESWVLVDGSRRGWLREERLDIYDNEDQARTAAESMSR